MIAPSPDLEAEVLEINERLYRAFREKNIHAIEALWAREHPVSCIHPGWSAVAGYDEVMRSWRGILANPTCPHIICQEPVVQLYGMTASVICFESIRGASTRLIATNLFCREGHSWRLVHHQAGPCQERFPPAQGEEDSWH